MIPAFAKWLWCALWHDRMSLDRRTLKLVCRECGHPW